MRSPGGLRGVLLLSASDLTGVARSTGSPERALFTPSLSWAEHC